MYLDKMFMIGTVNKFCSLGSEVLVMVNLKEELWEEEYLILVCV